MKRTDFLDILFNLQNDTYKPFRKDDQRPTYIHSRSNHPPSIKKQLPTMIAERLSNLSCSESVFKNESQVYQDALNSAGYTENLIYKKENKTVTPRKKQRSRSIIWFNPPFSDSVKTNVGGKFLALVDKHFKKSNLHKYFNRSTIKISYSCLPNIGSIIASNNKNVLQDSAKNENTAPKCNCRGGKNDCPLGGICLEKEIVYKAEIHTENKSHSYIGLTANTFKERYRNHISSFNNKKYEHHTSLSKHVWNLKTQNKKFHIHWSKIGAARAYNPMSKYCNLCLLEKAMILNADERSSINKRTELMNKCPHRRKFLLSTA